MDTQRQRAPDPGHCRYRRRQRSERKIASVTAAAPAAANLVSVYG